MAPKERRALALLFTLAVAGHLLRARHVAERTAPPAPAPLDPAADGDPIAHRDSARALAAPIGAEERIDPDRADAAELARLPGVGPSLARRIVADRESLGAFGGSAGLDRVAGIGPGLLRRIAPHLRSATGAADTPAHGDVAPVDLNRAGVTELDALPGIGVARARSIVAFRDSVGPFRQLEDLGRVPGLSPSVVRRLAGRIVIH